MANEFVSFNPYDEQLEALRQRQRMADMLRQQSMEPLESQVAPGGYVVPTSPILGLAKMLQAYGAGRSQRAIDKELGELRDRAAYDARQQQAEQTAAMKGIVGRLTGQRDEVGPMEQAVLTGAPMPPKPITVTPQMDRASQILSGKDEELAEFEPTAQYRYDPKDAQQMVMTSPAFDPSTRGQMLAAALKQTMEKPEAEEFGTTPVLGADGKYYLVSKSGKMVATGVAGPATEDKQVTPPAVTPVTVRGDSGENVVVDARTRAVIGKAPVDPPKSLQPLPPALRTQVAEATGANQRFSAGANTARSFISMIENKELPLSLTANIEYKMARATDPNLQQKTSDGKTPAYVNYYSLLRFVDQQVNTIIQAAKGAATEGDALRARQQILDNPNNEKVVVSALKDLERLMNQESKIAQQQIDLLTEGYQPLTGAGKPSPSQYPTVTTQAEYDALPSDSRYYEDGVLMRKP